MPVRKRKNKRRAKLTPDIEAWLRGDKANSRFIQFKPAEELQALWDAYGDPTVATFDIKKSAHPNPL